MTAVTQSGGSPAGRVTSACLRMPVAAAQTLIYGAALVATKALGLVMIPVTTGYLVPEEFARLEVLQSLADVAGLFVAFGIADTLFRFAGVAGEDTCRRGNAAGFTLVVAVISLVLGQIAVPWLLPVIPTVVGEVELRVLLATIALSGLVSIGFAQLRLGDRAGTYLAIAAARAVGQVGLAVVLLIGGFGVLGILLASLIASLALTILFAVLQSRATLWRFELAAMGLHLRYGGPLIAAGVALFVLGSFDRWVLAGAVPPLDLAEYGLAAKFGLLTVMFIQAFEMWWMPRRFATLHTVGGRDRAARIGAAGAALAALAAVTVAGWAPIVVTTLSAEAYHGALRYVPALAAIAAVQSITMTLAIGCYARSSLWTALIDWIAAALVAALYFLMIPRLGVTGAIIATAIAVAARLLLAMILSQRMLPLAYPFLRMGLYGALALAAIAANPVIAPVLGWLGTGLLVPAGLAVIGAMLGLLPAARPSPR